MTRRRALAAAASLALAACRPAPVGAGGTDASASDLPPSSPSADLPVQVLMIELPGLVDADGSGPLGDLVRELVAATPALRFQLDVQPLNRVVDRVSRGLCDIGLPDLRVRPAARGGLPYRQSTASLGSVSFVLYSNRTAPVTREQVRDAFARNRFDLDIEGPVDMFEFPVLPLASIEGALRKVEAGRIDALLWAQEEADVELRRLGLQQVHRSLFEAFDDVLMLPWGARGEFLDRVLGDSVGRLRASGRLRQVYEAVHRPFESWQPYT